MFTAVEEGARPFDREASDARLSRRPTSRRPAAGLSFARELEGMLAQQYVGHPMRPIGVLAQLPRKYDRPDAMLDYGADHAREDVGQRKPAELSANIPAGQT
jgi:hypothetical protein